MIVRGIARYDISDLKKHLYLTMDAKYFEQMIVSGKFSVYNEPDLPFLEYKTENLNFFIGDYSIRFVPKRAVQLVMIYKDIQAMNSDPIKACDDTQELLDNCDDRMTSELKDLSQDDILGTSCYAIIYSLGEENTRQLYAVLSGVPRHVKRYLTDERQYECDDGTVVVAEDGLPNEVYYYHDEKNVIRYTLDSKKGIHIGTE